MDMDATEEAADEALGDFSSNLVTKKFAVKLLSSSIDVS